MCQFFGGCGETRLKNKFYTLVASTLVFHKNRDKEVLEEKI